jgi:hypothetical protein
MSLGYPPYSEFHICDTQPESQHEMRIITVSVSGPASHRSLFHLSTLLDCIRARGFECSLTTAVEDDSRHHPSTLADYEIDDSDIPFDTIIDLIDKAAAVFARPRSVTVQPGATAKASSTGTVSFTSPSDVNLLVLASPIWVRGVLLRQGGLLISIQVPGTAHTVIFSPCKRYSIQAAVPTLFDNEKAVLDQSNEEGGASLDTKGDQGSVLTGSLGEVSDVALFGTCKANRLFSSQWNLPSHPRPLLSRVI